MVNYGVDFIILSLLNKKSVSLHWCSEIDSTWRQNVIKMKKWHSVQPSMALGQWTRKNFYSYCNIKFLRILIITAEKIYSTIYGINNRNWFSSSTPFPAQTITVFIGQLEFGIALKGWIIAPFMKRHKAVKFKVLKAK